MKEQNSLVTANALHPGVVNTDLFQYTPWLLRIPQNLLAYFFFMVSTVCGGNLGREKVHIKGKW